MIRRWIYGTIGVIVVTPGYAYLVGRIPLATSTEEILANGGYLVVCLLGFIAGALVAGTKD